MRREIEPSRNLTDLKHSGLDKLCVIRRNPHPLILRAVVNHQEFVRTIHTLMFRIERIPIALLREFRRPCAWIRNHPTKHRAIPKERSAKTFRRQAEADTLPRFTDDAVPECAIPSQARDVQHVAGVDDRVAACRIRHTIPEIAALAFPIRHNAIRRERPEGHGPIRVVPLNLRIGIPP